MQLKADTLLQGEKYKIILPLGQGGFGITYEAEQVLLRRKVAIKEFFMKDCCERDATTSCVTVGTGSQRALVEKFRSKFIKEAQMMAGFSHPHIVRVTDVFEENGTAYYVMDYLPGGSLADKVKKEGPLSEVEAEKYIRQVADALDYIHSQHTVHLDVKPSNILLDAKGDAVLIDFGISKHYDDAGEQTSSTPVGISKGYAPLEQGRDGDVSQFKPSTDIYALGATLYYLASGNVPPEASIVNEDGLDRPAGITDRIWRAIESAMRPRRKDRPQNVLAFLKLLDENAEKANSETTVIVQKATPKHKESLKRAPKTEPKFVEEKLKKWMWLLLAGVAGVAVMVALIIGGRGLIYPVDSTADNKTVVSAATGSINGHDWVDLGLSVKWATCNLGASSPSDYGGYYAWGETSVKYDYSRETLKYCMDAEGVHFSKYIPSKKKEYWSGSGKPDNRTRLQMSDDAARANWGGTWRMPTDLEWEELRTKCKWTWTNMDGINGYSVTGPSGNGIFLPAAGDRHGTRLSNVGSIGHYWSSSLDTDGPLFAYSLYFHSDAFLGVGWFRYSGYSVRPVTE